MSRSVYLLITAVLAATVGPAFAWVDADINNDGMVNLGDLNPMADNWQLPGPLTPGNLNNDGQVDLEDLSSLAHSFLELVQGLPVGVDLMQTDNAEANFTSQPIPADFFGPGSDPFDGVVALRGEPLGTFGPFEMGTADTIIHRTEHNLLNMAPDQAEIPIEIVALSLVSAEPIIVTYNGGAFEEPWEVTVDLLPSDPMNPNAGMMALHKTNPVGGTFDAILPVDVQINFHPLMPGSSPVSLPPTTLLMEGFAGNFADVHASPTAGLIVPFLETALALATQLHSPLLHMNLVPAQPIPGQGPPIHPAALIDPGATVVPDVGSLARGCHIMSDAFVGPGVVVGPDSQIGPFSELMGDNLVAEGVNLGAWNRLDPGAKILAGVQTGEYCWFEPGAIIGPGCVIGTETFIGPDAHIGNNTFINPGCLIGPGVTIGDNVNIGFGVEIPPETHIAAGAIIPDGAIITEGIYKCSEPLSGGNYAGTAGECQDAGGIVLHLGDDKISGDQATIDARPKENPGSVVPLPVDPCDPCTPDWVKEVIKDLKENDYHDPCGSDLPDACESVPIPDRDWVDPCYTCGDFAHDAERGLSGIPDPCDPNKKKYENVTITIYWKYKPNPAYDASQGDKAGNRKWLSDGSHALIDVHKDGQMVWIEPQTGGPPNPDLDFDNDGKVEYWDNPDKTKPNPPPDSNMSDDHVIIEVYPDRETAQAAGAPTG